MAEEINEVLVSQLEMSFDEAIAQGNIELARNIIEEVKELDIFSGMDLENELLNQPISSFPTV